MRSHEQLEVGRRPVVWSIAGTDSAGGAGIAADQRAADACGVHLCTVVAAVTAQNSLRVTRVEPLAASLIQAQVAALRHDLPPAAVKTGLLGGVAQVEAVAEAIDRLRADAPVALVVDPVLGASTGAGFADAATLAAYRALLLPRATLVTPNRREAAALLGISTAVPDDEVPMLARALRAAGAQAVCITGGDDAPAGANGQALALDWIDTPHAAGWLALPRMATRHHHGTGCTFATSAAAALAHGFAAADALVVAKMATAQALRTGGAAGAGAGPVRAVPGFMADPSLMPQLSWGPLPRFAPFGAPRREHRPLGLYGIADSVEGVARALAAGLRTLQLRIKLPARPDAAWWAGLRDAVDDAVALARAAGAELFINDHRELALQAGSAGLHLGQEDLLALSEEARQALRAPGAPGTPVLGISSHSLWELARARSLAPRYLACGPVWPTLTKAMPWLPQGLDNLAWWCRMAGAPVVAIGGILEPGQAEAAARAGADGVCIVRALAADPAAAVPLFAAALEQGRMAAGSLEGHASGGSEADGPGDSDGNGGGGGRADAWPAGWPHPSLLPATGVAVPQEPAALAG